MIKDCQARQYSDQMQCARCGTCWDMNDPEPPECRTDEQIRREHGREVLEWLKARLLSRVDNDVQKRLHARSGLSYLLYVGEEAARHYANMVPAGPERDEAIEIAEALHELGCKL